MNVADRTTAWIQGRTERQSERWHRRVEPITTQLPGWRTEARTRLLIRIYLGSLGLGFATAVGQIFWMPLLFVWIPFTLVSCVSWTMLRTVINTRDAAPADELDEYETDVLRTWQAAAYGWLVLLMLGLSGYLIVVSVLLSGDLSHWMYTAGLFTVLGMLSGSAMPTVAYATTFGPVPPQTH